MVAGAQGQVGVREAPDRVTGDARRVPVRRVLRTCRGAGESGAGDGAGVAAAGRPSAVPCRQGGTLCRSELVMDLDDVIPGPHYRICHSRVARAPLPAVWDALHRVTMSALPLGHALEGMRVLPARLSGKKARAAGRPRLSRRNSHSGAVLRAAPCRYLSRPQPGLAPARRTGTAASGRGGPACLVRTWMDQGRDGISPRTGPGRNLAQHRDPRARDGPEDQAGLRRVLARHPAGQQRDPPRGTESRRTPRRVVSHSALTCLTGIGKPVPAGPGQRPPPRLTEPAILCHRCRANSP